MKQRIRAIQICVNLAFTINKMKEIEEEGLINTVSSKSTRASKSKLIVVKQDLMKKFKISKEEITG